jgi:hypothetical protein
VPATACDLASVDHDATMISLSFIFRSPGVWLLLTLDVPNLNRTYICIYIYISVYIYIYCKLSK